MPQRHFFLEPGVDRTEYIALPVCGGWLGQVRVSLATGGASGESVIHEWTFIWPNAPRGRNYYRRTNVSSSNGYTDGVLIPERRYEKWLFQGESVMKIRYTSDTRISVLYETDRRYIPYPSLDQDAPSSANVEKAAPGQPGELNGVFYWRPTP